MKNQKKSFGSILLKQVLAASRFIGHGSRPAEKDRKPRNKDGSRIKKQRYNPGTAGLSMVSAAIKRHHGMIVSRRDRRAIASIQGKPFQAFYNGPAAEFPQRSRNFRRSKYNGRGELV